MEHVASLSGFCCSRRPATPLLHTVVVCGGLIWGGWVWVGVLGLGPVVGGVDGEGGEVEDDGVGVVSVLVEDFDVCGVGGGVVVGVGESLVPMSGEDEVGVGCFGGFLEVAAAGVGGFFEVWGEGELFVDGCVVGDVVGDEDVYFVGSECFEVVWLDFFYVGEVVPAGGAAVGVDAVGTAEGGEGAVVPCPPVSSGGPVEVG